MADLRHLLATYVHAHQTGNSVPPHIDAEARATLAAEAPAPAPAADPLPGFAATLIASQRPMDPDVAAVLTPEARWEMYDGAPAPAADGERDHVPDAGNMVAADGEAEELATLLAIGSSCAAGAKLSPEQCRRAAALLRQPAPAPVPAADGEHEELAQWLERIGDDYDDLYRSPSALIRPKLARAAALLREARPQPVPVADGEREEREELATFLTKEAVAMDYWFERDTAKKVRRAAALLREARPRPVAAPTPDDFRRWWRETGSDDSGPTPEMLLTANAWAEVWAARCAQPIPQPPQGGEVES